MPEGDSVWRLARRLRGQVQGQTVIASSFRTPRFATSDLSGATVLDAQPRGKHLLMRFDNAVTLHGHLRMDGSWRLHHAGWRPRTHDDRVRAWLDFGPTGVLAAHDMPVLELLDTAREHEVVGHLGPDVLDDAWIENHDLRDQAVANLRAQPERPIGEGLLDQRNLAGIGNLYKVEALFLAGVHPYAPAGAVPKLEKVVDVAHRLLRLNIGPGRESQPTTGSLRRGETHWAYGRYNKPCRRCRTPIAFREGTQGMDYDRETWWCPHCQPELETGNVNAP